MSMFDPSIGPFRDVADSPELLSYASPSTIWTLPELTKLAWVAKRIKISYRFITANQGNYIGDLPPYWGWSVFENQKSELELSCGNSFVEIERAPWAGYPDLPEEYSSFAEQLPYVFWIPLGSYSSGWDSIGLYNGYNDEALGVLPLAGLFAEYMTFYFEDQDPAPYEYLGASLMAGAPPSSSSPYVKTRENMLEIVTRDNDGVAKSVFYDMHADISGWPVDNPFPGTGVWADQPEDWGFRIDVTSRPFGEETIDITPYIKVEVLEWYSYNGTWDTYTGALIGDPLAS